MAGTDQLRAHVAYRVVEDGPAGVASDDDDFALGQFGKEVRWCHNATRDRPGPA